MVTSPDIGAHPQYILHGAGNTYDAVHESNVNAQKHHAEFVKLGGRRSQRRRMSRKRGYRRRTRRARRRKTRRRKPRRRSRRRILRGGATCGSNAKITVPSSPATVPGGGPQSFNSLSARGNSGLATNKCNSVYDGPYKGWEPIPST